jgi:hypothetical protein
MNIYPAPSTVLDIETAHGRPEMADAISRLEFAPDERLTAPTLHKRFCEARQKRKERLALIPGAPIIAVGLKTPGELLVLHSMRAEASRALGSANVFGFADERTMLMAVRDFLSSRADESTLLAGWNLAGFDLPRLRLAFLRSGLQLPSCLANEAQPICDLMRVFTRRFYADSSLFLSLSEACELMGIDSHKHLLTGAEVPALAQAGKVDEICAYNALDVTIEAEVFARLTGQSIALQ